MAPENRASVAALPALKVAVFRSTFGPSLSAKMPFSTPAMAAAWVTLGKYPRRSVTRSAGLADVVVVARLAVVVVVGLAVVVVGLAAAGAAALVVGVTAAGAVVSGAGTPVSGVAAAGAVTAPSLVAAF